VNWSAEHTRIHQASNGTETCLPSRKTGQRSIVYWNRFYFGSNDTFRGDGRVKLTPGPGTIRIEESPKQLRLNEKTHELVNQSLVGAIMKERFCVNYYFAVLRDKRYSPFM